MSSPFDQLGDSSSYSKRGKPKYRASGRGSTGSFWIVGLIMLALLVGGGIVAYAVLWRAGAVPGSEHEAAIRAHLQKNLHNPDGFEIVEIGKPKRMRSDPEPGISTKTEYFTTVDARIRAKTALGGKRLSTYRFSFDSAGKIVSADQLD